MGCLSVLTLLCPKASKSRRRPSISSPEERHVNQLFPSHRVPRRIGGVFRRWRLRPQHTLSPRRPALALRGYPQAPTRFRLPPLLTGRRGSGCPALHVHPEEGAGSRHFFLVLLFIAVMFRTVHRYIFSKLWVKLAPIAGDTHLCSLSRLDRLRPA